MHCGEHATKRNIMCKGPVVVARLVHLGKSKEISERIEMRSER